MLDFLQKIVNASINKYFSYSFLWFFVLS
uniref:Uncharacterized protein n=1 Tax=Rhizophora mucronata TaxID=61149 RepID=A0A2P2N3Y4_RHIMU